MDQFSLIKMTQILLNIVLLMFQFSPTIEACHAFHRDRGSAPASVIQTHPEWSNREEWTKVLGECVHVHIDSLHSVVTFVNADPLFNINTTREAATVIQCVNCSLKWPFENHIYLCNVTVHPPVPLV